MPFGCGMSEVQNISEHVGSAKCSDLIASRPAQTNKMFIDSRRDLSTNLAFVAKISDFLASAFGVFSQPFWLGCRPSSGDTNFGFERFAER